MIYNLLSGSYLSIDTKFVSCIVAFIVFEAAYFSEVVRAGIQSIGKGQINAAKALGMNYSQVMKLVILPQTFRKCYPWFTAMYYFIPRYHAEYLRLGYPTFSVKHTAVVR